MVKVVKHSTLRWTDDLELTGGREKVKKENIHERGKHCGYARNERLYEVLE